MNYAHTCTDIQRMFKCKIFFIHTLMKAFHIYVNFFFYDVQLPVQNIISHYYEPMVRATLIYPDLYIGEIQALITVRQFANSCINIFEAARCSMNRKSQTFLNSYIFRIQMWFFFQIDNNTIYPSICLLVFPVIRLISHFE